MTIKEIKSIDESKTYEATITLQYDELQKISAALCKLENDDDFNKRKDFWKLARNMHFLFDIVKNSCVDDWTFESGFYHTLRHNGKDVSLEDVIAQTERHNG